MVAIYSRRLWARRLSGDYFENCNCDVVCPYLVSKNAPLTSRPSEGECNVVLIFHIESGSYDGTSLDDLNVVLAAQRRVPWQMETGRSLPTSTNAPMTNRPRRWGQSSPGRRAGQFPTSLR